MQFVVEVKILSGLGRNCFLTPSFRLSLTPTFENQRQRQRTHMGLSECWLVAGAKILFKIHDGTAWIQVHHTSFVVVLQSTGLGKILANGNSPFLLCGEAQMILKMERVLHTLSFQ